MSVPIATHERDQLEDCIEAFESACAGGAASDLAEFLPPDGDPRYAEILGELVRVDLELNWTRGTPRRVEDYRERFPQLFEQLEVLWGVALEEYRLRVQAGEEPSPEEYRRRFRMPLGLARERSAAHSEAPAPPAPDPFHRAASAYRAFRQADTPTAAAALDSWCDSFQGDPEHARVFYDLHRSSPAAAERFAQAVTSFPEAGNDFVGFRLVRELGRGAFGRVFLARQGELADRYVALKISADTSGESRTLAQLQHTNIVPIYSTHRTESFQAVCMPYFGATTLAHVLESFASRHAVPISGKELVSTLHNRRSSTRKLSDSSAFPPTTIHPELAAPADPVVAVARASSQPSLKTLEGLTYVEAVLWIGARLADGLAHAHDRGILHRDLKPANVLLTDDGQPMLLDFNLSEDSKLRAGASAASIGGTLPYMAPEHLEAFQEGKRPVDARSDLFSLGIILHELLTGQPAFPAYGGAGREILPRLIADRKAGAADVRGLNRAVSPAAAAIVRRCLQAEPAARYQSAHQLREDLERHLQNLPLKHTREPSPRERARKWARRHPRLTSSASVAAAALVLVAALAAAFVVRGRHLASLQARAAFQSFEDDVRSAQFVLYARTEDRAQLDQGIDQCQRALERYRVLEEPNWQQGRSLALLPAADRQKLRRDAGELLFLSARATAMLTVYEPEEARQRARLGKALEMNDAALSCYGETETPLAVWEERVDLLRRLGQGEQARQLADRCASLSFRNARDYFLAGHALALRHNFREALPLLENALQRDPQSFSAWFVAGNCHDGLMQLPEAVACYATCIALRPDFHWAWFNRGLARLRLGQTEGACADFTRTLEIEPQLADAYLNRAIGQQMLAHYHEAIADLTRALELGAPRTEVLLRRARVRDKAGDAAGARRDFEDGMRLPPTDEGGWVARGLARLERDPRAALADFEEALKLNPRSFAALQNQAHIYADLLGDDRQAVATLDRAVSLYPDNVLCRAGRGVSRARLGQRDGAIADAQESLLLDSHPANLYQVSCIYALTSRQHAEDRFQAFPLLSAALKSGFGVDMVDTDHDLDPLRSSAEFKRLVMAAKVLHPGR